MKSLLYLMLFFTPLFAYSACNKLNFTHLNIDLTEAWFCPTCQSQGGAQSHPTLPLIPAEDCFKKSISSGRNIKIHRSCPNQDGQVINSESICPDNETYLKTTMKSFHDVTRCLDVKPEYFFALINRESRFQLTAQSHTGASCYGQLTGIAILDVNQQLPYTVKNSHWKNCEHLIKNLKVIKSSARGKSASARCELYSNPYTCFFYSAFYYQRAVEEAKALIKKLSVVSVTMTDGTLLLFLDEKAKEKYFNNRSDLRRKIRRQDRMSLLKDNEEVAQVIAYKTYNGGPRVRTLFEGYMNTVKNKLWNPPSQKKLIQDMFVKKPDGISSAAFLDSFSTYVGNNYGGSHAREVAAFGKKVFGDYKDILGNNASPGCGEISAKKILQPKPPLSVPI